ncbi:MAG: tetratricopeptide repeat protein, partial [Alphaproteobacteria bacterium]|nr:tetratricopeptide repeat protein [Alphaproteobacteria bacterium]
MKTKWMLAACALGVVALMGGYELAAQNTTATPYNTVTTITPAAGAPEVTETATVDLPPLEGFAGKFLASHFAQTAYDWETASDYLGQVITHDPENFDLIKRAMVLAMGTGDSVTAAKWAQELLKAEPENGFAHLIVAVDALARKDNDAARIAMEKMPEGDMTSFAKPLLLGWAEAGRGTLEISGLAQVPMHLYHGPLMALMLDNKTQARLFTEQIMQVKGLTQGEAMRVADMLAALGDKDKALGLYQGLKLQEGASHDVIDKKISAVEKGDEAIMKATIPPMQVTTVQQGAALALYDMASILYQEESDSSTKLFAQMALAVDPDLIDARLLLAETLVRNDRLDEAIALLKTVPATYPSFMETQRHAAELLAEAGRQDEALQMMNGLYEQHGDIESLIRVGDIYRHAEDYNAALKAYNRAAKAIGKDVPEEYWHLLYARGMVHEREGHWKEAVADLTAAVEYRPNHPYLLNYLGYGWADKGENLEKSLELIRRAVALRPMDGYITDSLGWVLYRMQKFEEAVPHLERAVELLPYDSTINDHLGDAYWQVGRRLEARFQWRRAINSSEDAEVSAVIAAKLKD